jgi:hypothetical protein
MRHDIFVGGVDRAAVSHLHVRCLAAAQTWEPISANPRVDIAYFPPNAPQLEPVYQAVKEP